MDHKSFGVSSLPKNRHPSVRLAVLHYAELLTEGKVYQQMKSMIMIKTCYRVLHTKQRGSHANEQVRLTQGKGICYAYCHIARADRLKAAFYTQKVCSRAGVRTNKKQHQQKKMKQQKTNKDDGSFWRKDDIPWENDICAADDQPLTRALAFGKQ